MHKKKIFTVAFYAALKKKLACVLKADEFLIIT